MKIMLATLSTTVLLLPAGCPPAETCETNETQSCDCPDGSTGAQTCLEDRSGWTECECGGGDDDVSGDDDTTAGDDDTTAGDDDTTAGDDDSADDDTGDDDTGDDDDDDSTPNYTGDIDMDNAYLESACWATVPQGDPAGGQGTFAFHVEMPGWADSAWVELWSISTSYCEGYDPVSGNPCDNNGIVRPGWDLDNIDYGWDPGVGFWDVWELDLDYHEIWPPANDASMFACEDAGSGFELWYCAVDYYTYDAFCVEYPMAGW